MTIDKELELRLKEIEEELSKLKVHHAVVLLSEALELRLKEIEEKLTKVMRKK